MGSQIHFVKNVVIILRMSFFSKKKIFFISIIRLTFKSGEVMSIVRTVIIGLFAMVPFCSAMSIPDISDNACLSIGKRIVADKAVANLDRLNDGWDSTSCTFTGPIKISIEVNATNCPASKLMLNFRNAGIFNWNDTTYSFQSIRILTSHDSTDGLNGTWTLVKTEINQRNDRVLVFTNNKPRWVMVEETTAADIALARLEIFQSAPAGKRNDYWIFFGASLTQGDMGCPTYLTYYFNDIIRRNFPNRYPIIVNQSLGGEVAQNGAIRAQTYVFPENPQATFFGFEHGGNNISGGRPYPGGVSTLSTAMTNLFRHATNANLCPIPGGITFRNYPDMDWANNQTLSNEMRGSLPYSENVFNPLIKRLARYAYNTNINRPIIDLYQVFKDNYATDLVADGVHQTTAGKNTMNKQWAMGASNIIYSKKLTGMAVSAIALSRSIITNNKTNSLVLTATALDSDGSITKVESDWGSLRGPSPIQMNNVGGDNFSLTIKIAPGSSAGKRSVYAKAFDNLNNHYLRWTNLTVVDKLPPTAPVIHNVNLTGGTYPTLIFSASSDDTALASYKVFKGTNSNIYFSSNTITATNWSDGIPADAGKTYYFRVKAIDTSGNHSAASTEQSIFVPSSSKMKSLLPSSLILSNHRINNITFTLQTTTAQNMVSNVLINLTSLNGNSQTLMSNISGKTIWRYSISYSKSNSAATKTPLLTVQLHGGRTYLTNVIIQYLDKTPPLQNRFTSIIGAGKNVTLNWTLGGDETLLLTHILYRGTTSGVYTSSNVFTPRTTFGETVPTDNTRYYYALRSRDSANNMSPFSPETNIMIANLDTTPPQPATVFQTKAISKNGQFQAALTWIPSTDIDLSHLMILRSLTPITSTPVPQTSYTQGNELSAGVLIALKGLPTLTTWTDSNSLSYGSTVYYRLVMGDANNNYSTPADASLQIPALSGESKIKKNLTSDATIISLEISEPTEKVKVSIYNSSGKLVRLLVDKELTTGLHEIPWDLKNSQGLDVSSGVYLVVMETGKGKKSDKVMIIRGRED